MTAQLDQHLFLNRFLGKIPQDKSSLSAQGSTSSLKQARSSKIKKLASPDIKSHLLFQYALLGPISQLENLTDARGPRTHPSSVADVVIRDSSVGPGLRLVTSLSLPTEFSRRRICLCRMPEFKNYQRVILGNGAYSRAIIL